MSVDSSSQHLATIAYSFGAIVPVRFNRVMRARDEMKYDGDEWLRRERANFVMDVVALMFIGLLIVTTAAFCWGMLP